GYGGQNRGGALVHHDVIDSLVGDGGAGDAQIRRGGTRDGSAVGEDSAVLAPLVGERKSSRSRPRGGYHHGQCGVSARGDGGVHRLRGQDRGDVHVEVGVRA